MGDNEQEERDASDEAGDTSHPPNASEGDTSGLGLEIGGGAEVNTLPVAAEDHQHSRPHHRRRNSGGSGGSGRNLASLFTRGTPGTPPSHLPAFTRNDPGFSSGHAETVFRKVASRFNTVANALDPRNLMNSPSLRSRRWPGSDGVGDGEGEGGNAEEDNDDEEEEDRPRGTVDLYMYSFGAPRVGNAIYSGRYNEVVPHSFRVVVDGDPVPVRKKSTGVMGRAIVDNSRGNDLSELPPMCRGTRCFCLLVLVYFCYLFSFGDVVMWELILSRVTRVSS